MKSRIIAAALTLALGVAGSAAAAGLSVPPHYVDQTPFAAGGLTDAMARNIANRVGQVLKQTILIETWPAPADDGRGQGRQILPMAIPSWSAAWAIWPPRRRCTSGLRYDPVRISTRSSAFPDTPLVLLVGAGSPHKDVKIPGLPMRARIPAS